MTHTTTSTEKCAESQPGQLFSAYLAARLPRIEAFIADNPVRALLVGEGGKESDMYAATLTTPGEEKIQVLLRSEQSGVMTWRTYLDGGFAGEATAVLQ